MNEIPPFGEELEIEWRWKGEMGSRNRSSGQSTERDGMLAVPTPDVHHWAPGPRTVLGT